MSGFVSSMAKRVIAISAVMIVIAVAGLFTADRTTANTAGTDGDVVLGACCQANSGDTGVTSSGSEALTGTSTAPLGTGVRGYGHTAVWGTGSDIGVYGSGGSTGVKGEGTIGVHGIGLGADGVVGETGNGPSGVSGHNTGGGNGLAGISNAGPLGVNGKFGAAVFADNTSNGVALWARNLNAGGTGGVIEAWGTGSTGLIATGKAGATALSVDGPAVFSRSGIAKVLAPKARVKVSNVAMGPASLILATIQANVAGTWVQGVIRDVATSSFTIVLNKTVAGDTRVAWFVVN